jgi:hypothetical protein
MMNTCKLCDIESTLRKSHILPRSLILKAKNGDSQLHVFINDKKPTYSNSDPKENLLCNDCEQLLSKNYEKTSIELFKKRRNVVKHINHIEFIKFDYKSWYLFYLSILWRASIATINPFEKINIFQIENLAKKCILNDILKVSEYLDMDEIIKINMFKVVDRSKKIDESTLRNLLMSLTARFEIEHKYYFLMTHGFLIKYEITFNYINFKKQMNYTIQFAESFRNNHKIVPIVDITESKFLTEEFNALINNL